MKIVFFNIPAHGHTNPTLGVVKELINNNHDVYYYSYEIMREKIESSGAHFIPCDKFDSQTKLSNEDKEKIAKDLVFSTNLIVDMTLRLDDEILKEMQELKPDVIIADSMAFWGKLIAKKLNIPFISSTTTFAFNKYSARVMKQEGPGLFQLIKCIPKINKSLKRLREKGYEVKSMLDKEKIKYSDDEDALDLLESEVSDVELDIYLDQTLTERQKEVIELALFGYSHEEICARLHITQPTLYEHLRNIKKIINSKP